MQYVMIENPGIAPQESFTVLGASTKGSGDESIGRFGSGNKHGVCVLLRHGIPPVVFCGHLRMQFTVRPTVIDDGMTSTEFGQVQVQYGGRDITGKSRSNTEDLSFVMEYGRHDWASVGLALREFVSNAIDHAEKYNRHHHLVVSEPWDGTVVKVVNENQVRAKSGHTRVFIPLTTETNDFVENIRKWFLHFENPDLISQTVLPKNDRSMDKNAPAIYRRGVRVREFSGVESLFDYNLDSLDLDESRQASDWDVMAEAAKAFRDASHDQLVQYWFAMINNKQYWEMDFSAYHMNHRLHESDEIRQKREERWCKAFRATLGPEAVLCIDESQAQICRNKGLTPLVVPQDTFASTRQLGIRTYDQVLDFDEQHGRKVIPASELLVSAVKRIYSRMQELDMTRNKPLPEIYEFTTTGEVSHVLFGFYREGAVYFNHDFVGSADTIDLQRTIVEELSHYVTEARDHSPEFKDYLVSLAAAMI